MEIDIIVLKGIENIPVSEYQVKFEKLRNRGADE